MRDRSFAIALHDLCDGLDAFRPPKRIRVSEAATEALIMKQPGMAGGNWKSAETPYMVEPMDMQASRAHEAVVFVGPARSGKSLSLLLGGLTHTVLNDIGDSLLIHMTKEKAREFSKTDLHRALDNSPRLAAMKSPRAVDDNTFDVMFRNGMWYKVGWPTNTNLASSTYRYTYCTDYDRIENVDNVDGEGPLFDQLRKRTTTYGSRGMTTIESSPGKPVIDPNWAPATPHEAPPVKGILGLYNLSDRRRWYWACPDCHDYFEAAPGLGLFNLPADEQLMSEVRTISVKSMADHFGGRIVCPCCGSLIEQRWKPSLNLNGIWVPDGVVLDDLGLPVGQPLQSAIAGYWLGGVAAAYQKWVSLVERYLLGLKNYALTGDEETLKTTVNVDQGMPYTSRHLIEARGSRRGPAERAEVGLKRFVCPPETRCVVVAVDVQGGTNARFVKQAVAYGPNMQRWVIDRSEIKLSKRPGQGSEFAPIDPARYPEDWDVLTEEIVRSTYRTAIDGREIRVKMTIVDSGGEGKKGGGEGVSHNAYAWFRRLVKQGLGNRVRLYKGEGKKGTQRIRETLVGARRPGEKGDVPLLLCNTNLLSDDVAAGLSRETAGPAYIHLPAVQHPHSNPDGWVTQAFFDELNAEVRNEDGVWQQIRKRNETFDLLRMAHVGALHLGLDKIEDWSRALPGWLLPLEQNTETITVEERRAMKANTVVHPLAPPAPIERAARARRSSVAAL